MRASRGDLTRFNESMLHVLTLFEDIDHTTARDFVDGKRRWAPFLLGWDHKGTVEVFTTKTKKAKVDVGDLVKTLWEGVSTMVQIVIKNSTTLDERHLFATTTADPGSTLTFCKISARGEKNSVAGDP